MAIYKSCLKAFYHDALIPTKQSFSYRLLPLPTKGYLYEPKATAIRNSLFYLTVFYPNIGTFPIVERESDGKILGKDWDEVGGTPAKGWEKPYAELPNN